MKKKDYSYLFGTTQGKLTILREESVPRKSDGKKSIHLVCECDCGNIYYSIPFNIVNKKVFSCGCASNARKGRPNSHGMSKTRFYKIWCGILKRCNNKNESSYINYGGRGIKVCKEWTDFPNFKADMYAAYLKHVEEYGEEDTSIERLDVNGNYTKKNCTWATRKEQNTNTRQVNHYEYKGEMLDLSEIARREGMNYRTLRSRILDYGWTLEEALQRSHLKWSKKKADLFDYKGQQLTLKQIAKLEGIGYTTLYNRVNNIGLSLDEAIHKIPHKKTR